VLQLVSINHVGLLHCVEVCCRVWFVAVCRSALQCIVECCSSYVSITSVCCIVLKYVAGCGLLQCVAVALQCVADCHSPYLSIMLVCCSVLHCVAGCGLL